MMRKFTYKTTVAACFIGYVVQAMTINFIPLLFVFFEKTYQLSVGQLTSFVTVSFAVQLAVDMTAALYVDKIGYRASVLLSQAAAALGYLLLPVLPGLLPPYAGILICVILMAIGGGLIEVLINPIVEACPVNNKEQAISLLHSFYCWGHVGVVLLSTLFFTCFGIARWQILAVVWALVPIANGIIFCKTPIAPLLAEDEKGLSLKDLFSNRTFLVLLLMMLAAGASEQAVSQWTSAFAEQGLGVSKTQGDLMGTMLFAALMGTARAIHGKYGEKIRLERFMRACALGCIAAYLLVSLSPLPLLSLAGCGICGFCVGIMWPGNINIAAKRLRGGGTAMFALLALAGDCGCTLGPTAVGLISGRTGRMQTGILFGTVFPALMLLGLLLNRKKTSADS